ncbi:MAG: peptidase domain-containing ABC transporter [Salibacteraceae bacterium]
MLRQFPFFQQADSMDCGPTCLRMVAKYHGRAYSLQFLREKCYIDRAGVSLKGISEAAEYIGLRTLAVKLSLEPEGRNIETPALKKAPLPCIVHWNQNHFVVVYKIEKSKVFIADPASGKIGLSYAEFNRSYVSESGRGIALLVEKTPGFNQTELDEEAPRGLQFILQYLYPHRKLMWQLVLGLLLGTLFQLIFPFLTQSIVDSGIDTQNLGFIYLILGGQLMIFLGQTAVRFIQRWILLHISIRISVNLIADFLVKLMKLPLGFFDAKNTGDLLQRIGDHNRIESFLTHSSLTALFSVFNLLVFGLVLAYYSGPIFLIFLGSSFIYVLWIFLFLKRRKEVDYRAFQQMADNQDALIEIIQGMPEIKLQGSQLKRRWKWTVIQAKLFRTQLKALSISQYQDAGALSISQLKDILITFMAAKLVLEGEITLGMMLAIQFIIGQLNSPLQQLIQFIRDVQDASISLERLSEIHVSSNEENEYEDKIKALPEGDIVLEDLSFSYTPIADQVLKNVSFTIPKGKTTAIVGTSGSGKTTLVKLLLGFYKPTQGKIVVGNTNLNSIYQKAWRANCGVVMQEGFIFSDTIGNNISECDEKTDFYRVKEAIEVANIEAFIQSLPLGIHTMIGAKGNGLSQGQKQRLLIARAVYKNPDFLFFDEATNALDANNEKVIMHQLNTFLQEKTAVVVAHRLSTVRSADQIIVLEGGEVVEQGTHSDLIDLKGSYFTLVQNQLELGN